MTKAQFAAALRKLPRTGTHERQFLLAHANAPARAMTMRRLANAAGYADGRAINLRYGLLAKRIAEKAGVRPKGISLGILVDFIPPKRRSKWNISNAEYVLVMKQSFAAALRQERWI